MGRWKVVSEDFVRRQRKRQEIGNKKRHKKFRSKHPEVDRKREKFHTKEIAHQKKHELQKKSSKRSSNKEKYQKKQNVWKNEKSRKDRPQVLRAPNELMFVNLEPLMKLSFLSTHNQKNY